MNSAGLPALDSRGSPITGTRQRQPRTILTTVRRRRGGRINWKRRALTIAVHLVALVIAIVMGAGMFVGLQKMEAVNLKRRCWKLKDDLKEEFANTCSKSTTSDECTQEWKRKRIEELARCYGSPSSAPKPPTTMARALILAYSTYSTIGYGNVAAKSVAGRIFVMVYALIGIPLFLAFLNHFGKWFHYWLVCAYEHLRRRTGAGKHFILTTTDSEDPGVFLFALLIETIYLSLVAGLYALLQPWTYWQSFYFAYQSMALIGFGDVYLEVEDPSFVMLHLTLTTIGIVLLAMCFFILRDWWARVVEAISETLAVKLKFIAPAAGKSNDTGAGMDDDTLQELQEVSISLFNTEINAKKGKKAAEAKLAAPKRAQAPAKKSRKLKDARK